MLADLPKDKMIILFDGICNFCDSTVQFLIKHDRKDLFRFAPIQSTIGEKIVRHLGVDTTKVDSILLYEPGKGYCCKSEAAIRIARALGGIYSLAGIFSILPRSLTDLVYDYIAGNRYKWFGQKTECMIPTPEMKAKFLG
jgi:predicted DCC family thiol-disulfide oxidoreductase YuxK